MVIDLGMGRVVESQADVAYRAIYDLVLRSKPDEGAIWFERGLSEQLQLGRTPVREGLKRLQHEGLLVATLAHGGLTAARIPVTEVRDVYRLRAVLESLAAELAAERSVRGELSRLQLEELGKRAVAMRERTNAADTGGAAEANRLFHEYLTTLAGNTFVENALARLWSRIAISSLSNLIEDSAWVSEVHKNHDDIVRFIIEGDPMQAAATARNHIHRAADVYLEHHSANQASTTSESI